MILIIVISLSAAVRKSRNSKPKRKATRKNTNKTKSAAVQDADGDAAWPSTTDNLDDDACPYCFLSPCATSFAHHWLGDGQAACAANLGLRYQRYKHYWKYIGNRGGWNMQRYLDKKRTALRGRQMHVREIMPWCVLKQVRSLYPNLANVPYVDHMWD